MRQFLPDKRAASLSAEGNVLVNLVENAWFGKSPASVYPYVAALILSVEYRLVRVTNSGVGIFVEPTENGSRHPDAALSKGRFSSYAFTSRRGAHRMNAGRVSSMDYLMFFGISVELFQATRGHGRRKSKLPPAIADSVPLYVQDILAVQKTAPLHHIAAIASIKASGLAAEVNSLLGNQVENRKNKFLCGGNCRSLLIGCYQEPSMIN